MNNLQRLALAFVLGYVIGDMIGLEKSECIYLAFISSITPMMFIVGDLFKKKDKQSS